MQKNNCAPTTALKRLLSPYAIIASVALLVIFFLWIMMISPSKRTVAIPSISKKPHTIDHPRETTAESGPRTIDTLELFEYPTETTTCLPEMKTNLLSPLPGEKISSRWIVVTSVQLPTEDVKLLGTLSKHGWRVLVVGDMSSPSDWEAPEGVRFLSYQEAMTLGYNLLSFQRWKTYSVKNVGYLFAIQHGAKMIYDTDDDNHPTDDLRSMLSLAGHLSDSANDDSSPTESRALVWKPNIGDYSLPVINTLPHFGQATLWPRGFPLTEVARPPPRRYVICKSRPPSWIQGVVNGDPDMDAIFRLTRKHFNTPINLTFDHAPSVIVPEHFFVQSNSQNTLFTYNALALMFFPFSKNISMRETDIWRAYIGQPMLWLAGARKGYVSPNAFQARNPHDYLKDFADEGNLYKYAGQLISFLASWKCPVSLDFGECLIKIYEDLAMKELIAAHFDVSSVTAWITDLRRMNFKFPRREEAEDCLAESAEEKDQRLVQFFPVEQPVPLPAHDVLNRIVPLSSSENEGETTFKSANCSLPTSPTLTPIVQSSSVTLAISLVNTPVKATRATALNRLNLLYKAYFERRIFCVDSSAMSNADFLMLANREKVTVLETYGKDSASLAVDCLKQIVAMNFDTQAFAFLSINDQSALLSDIGINDALALSNGSRNGDLMFGGCSVVESVPSVLILRSKLIADASFNAARILRLCSGESSTTSSDIKLLSENCSSLSSTVSRKTSVSLLLNCTSISDSHSSWSPPFCRL